MKEDNNAKPVSTDTPKAIDKKFFRRLKNNDSLTYQALDTLVDKINEAMAALSPQQRPKRAKGTDAKPTPSDTGKALAHKEKLVEHLEQPDVASDHLLTCANHPDCEVMTVIKSSDITAEHCGKWGRCYAKDCAVHTPEPATLREQIEQAIIFNTKHLSTYHPSMKNVIVDMEMLCDQLLALVDQYSDKRVREELAEVRNIAWDSSGDGSNLGKAYELIVTAKLNHHSKEAE